MNLSTRKTFFILLFLGLFLMTLRPVADPDFWWHLRSGQMILDTRAIPHSDPFSFTLLGKTWIAHEWLSEVFLYILFQVGGYGLLIVTFSVIITGAFLLVFLRSPGKPYAAGFALLLAALASAPTWGVRPQMLSVLFTALFLFILDRFEEKQDWKILIPIPLLTALWVNLHAGYFLGFAVIGISIAGEVIQYLVRRDKRQKASLRPVFLLSAALFTSLLASLANPNSIKILIYPFETLTSKSMMLFIEEWFSPNFQQPEWIPLAILLLALVAAPLLARRPVPIKRLLLVLFLGLAALRSMRHVPLFALTTIPILAEQISGVTERIRDAGIQPRSVRWLNIFLILLVLMATGLRTMDIIQQQPSSETNGYPKAAVDWIVENKPDGQIYNTYGWGGYLIWRLHPDYLVYIDGWADVYGDEFIYDYLQIYSGQQGWESALAKVGVKIVLAEPGAGITNALRLAPGWRLVHEDNLSVLFLHK